MKPIEIVELIKISNPDLLGKLPDEKVAKIVRAALNQLGKHLDAVDEGVVMVPGFGSFQVRQVVREKDGLKKTVKVIGFRVAKPKIQ